MLFWAIFRLVLVKYLYLFWLGWSLLEDCVQNFPPAQRQD
jgi:hypothetical protein